MKGSEMEGPSGVRWAPGLVTALLALLVALAMAVIGLATALGQDEAGQSGARNRDWRLLRLVQDGALVEVADLQPTTAPGSPTAVPAEPDASGPAEPAPGAGFLRAPTLSIDDERRVSGWTGCNAWTATYELEEDALSLGPIASTRAACPEPVATLESTYLEDLALVAAWAMGSDTADPSLELLFLSDAQGDPLLVYMPLPASPVLGSWQVSAHRDAGGALVPSVVGAEPTATFDAQGRITGSTGCNSYGAGYIVDGQELAIGPVATTRSSCAELLAAQEQDFLAALEASARAASLGDTSLLLTDSEGSATLILESIAPEPAPSPTPEPTAVPTPTTSPTPARARVPDLRGETEADAITALNDVDLFVGDRFRRSNDSLNAGLVIRTDPEAGTRVSEGSRVDLYVSRGPAATPTPRPTAKPTPRPTARPTPRPTPRPTATPTSRPTARPTPTPRPTPDPGTLLDGSSWVLRDFRDSSGSVVVVPATVTVTADFETGRVSGFSGCNTYSGSYTTSGSRIDITGFATTGLACDGQLMSAEATYLASLGAVDRLRFRDDETLGRMLVLTGPDEQTRLRYITPGS
jgi:heat shock protein HslJ